MKIDVNYFSNEQKLFRIKKILIIGCSKRKEEKKKKRKFNRRGTTLKSQNLNWIAMVKGTNVYLFHISLRPSLSLPEASLADSGSFVVPEPVTFHRYFVSLIADSQLLFN